MKLWLEDARPELDLPEHLQPAALIVVVETGEDDAAGLVRSARRDDVLDEILPVPHLHDVAGCGPDAAVRTGEGPGRGYGVVSRGFKAGVVEIMGAAGGAQLVAAEGVEQAGEAEGESRSQDLDLRLLGATRRNRHAKLPAYRSEARLGQKLEDAAWVTTAGCAA